MGGLRWFFERIERAVFLGAAVAGILMLLLSIADRKPDQIVQSATPDLLKDAPQNTKFAELQDRLLSDLRAAQCEVIGLEVVSISDKPTDAADTTHNTDAFFMQSDIRYNDQLITVQGNGRGAAAQADAQTLLSQNFIFTLKELDLCG